MTEAKSSLDYWNERWAAAPWSFDTSWPDFYARRLELAALKKYLPFDKGPILELGCGNLALAEDNDLLLSIAKSGYQGVDGAMAAVNVAEQRLAPFSTARAAHMDLTTIEAQNCIEMELRGTQHQTVLTKRTLQNLQPSERAKLWPAILCAPHGVLIEGTEEGLRQTNGARWRELGDEDNPCTPPAYNYYLTDAEVQMLWEAGAEWHPFMSHYYYETRAKRNLRTWDSPVHRDAYKESLRQIKDGKFEGGYGPVCLFVW